MKQDALAKIKSKVVVFCHHINLKPPLPIFSLAQVKALKKLAKANTQCYTSEPVLLVPFKWHSSSPNSKIVRYGKKRLNTVNGTSEATDLERADQGTSKDEGSPLKQSELQWLPAD